MSSALCQEIQAVAENADKCINYPIGEKLAAFMRNEDEQESTTNFVLSGVLIFAAAKIYGRKVDFLEQEILGVAKNFEQVELANKNDGNDKENNLKEGLKKSRTKKYAIKDSVNLDKVVFEEKPIVIVTRNDINKTIARTSKLTRLQKMKEFFLKNKVRSGKLAIPKSMLLLDEVAVSNFGKTLIHDYDDHKDIVGSRRDFRSYSHYINSSTGELQNDLNLSIKQSSRLERKSSVEADAIIADDDGCDEMRTHQLNTSITLLDEKSSPKDLLLNIDEGIDLDDLDPATFLPIQPIVKMNDILRHSPSLFPENMKMNEPFDMNRSVLNVIDQVKSNENDFDIPVHPLVKVNDILRQSPSLFPVNFQMNDSVDLTFSMSVLSVMDQVKKVSDFSLPNKLKCEVSDIKMRNIFMVPIKRLRHKCLFDLPNDSEFRELKRRKIEQYKPISSSSHEPTNRRMFKFLNTSSTIDVREVDDDNIPFCGFTKDEQNESPYTITYNSSNTSNQFPPHTAIDITDNSLISENSISVLRKVSNDSGFESECINSSNEDSSIDHDNDDILECNSSQVENDNKINISGADSCIGSSLVSGNSGEGNNISSDLSSFLDEFKNSTANDDDELNLSKENQSLLESEERIKQMRQSAMNVAKWKEFLKPILAESEKRSKIDMHEYGVMVINKIGDVSKTKTFQEITEPGKMPAFFLTMLQLTNNKNIELNFGRRSIDEPTSLNEIKLTLKSKIVHKEKFDEMGQQFEAEEKKKTNILKRKAQSTPKNLHVKRSSIMSNDSFSFITPNQSIININDRRNISMQLSQASSGYFSQESYSDFE